MSQTYHKQWAASTTDFLSYYLTPETTTHQLRRSFRIELKQGEDGWIIASCPSLQGAMSQGKTKEEAIRNITDVIFLFLQDIYNEESPEFTVLWDEI